MLIVETLFAGKYHQNFLTSNTHSFESIFQLESNTSEKFIKHNDNGASRSRPLSHTPPPACIISYSEINAVISQYCSMPQIDGVNLYRIPNFHIRFKQIKQVNKNLHL